LSVICQALAESQNQKILKEFTSIGNKASTILGVILIVTGAIVLFYRGIPYTRRDIVIDMGPVNATAETSKTWPMPPILGGLAIAGGIPLIIVGSRKT
jgi:hypothetical protein